MLGFFLSRSIENWFRSGWSLFHHVVLTQDLCSRCLNQMITSALKIFMFHMTVIGFLVVVVVIKSSQVPSVWPQNWLAVLSVKQGSLYLLFRSVFWAVIWSLVWVKGCLGITRSGTTHCVWKKAVDDEKVKIFVHSRSHKYSH